VAKQKGCNAFYAGLDDNSNVALAGALRAAGVKPKVVVFPTGYEPSIIGSPAWRSVQGGYFDTAFRPFQLPNAGTRQMQSALEKYAHFKTGQFPSFSQYESWLGADLMIKGLELAGKNPTRAGVIHALRNVKDYTGNGLLPGSINYSTIFGHDPKQSCGWYMLAEKNGFVHSSSQPWCGTDLPGTKTAAS
jgi:branched-chain amino acid transport system substrate-binding protein